MMKRFSVLSVIRVHLFHIAISVVVILSAIGCDSKTMTLSCDFNWALKYYEKGASIDSVVIRTCSSEGVYSDLGSAVMDGNIALFSARVERPSIGRAVCFLSVPGGTGCSEMAFVAEPGRITADEASAKGTKSNDAITEAIEKLRTCADDSLAITNIINAFAGRYDKASTILLIEKSISLIGKELWLTIVESVNEDIRTFPEIGDAINKVSRLIAMDKAKRAISPGTTYTDFRGEWEGREYALSDYVGHGQYVLLDFWASWCMPCRKEIPYIKRVYDRYKDKGLVVLGVAVSNDKPEDTAEAMKSLGIEYTVFHEVDSSASNAYGIQSIPQILLIGPDGTILANSLRGEAIEETVSRFFQ